MECAKRTEVCMGHASCFLPFVELIRAMVCTAQGTTHTLMLSTAKFESFFCFCFVGMMKQSRSCRAFPWLPLRNFKALVETVITQVQPVTRLATSAILGTIKMQIQPHSKLYTRKNWLLPSYAEWKRSIRTYPRWEKCWYRLVFFANWMSRKI